MLDTSPLDAAVDDLAGRLRALPQSRLRRGAAARGLALARELAAWAQHTEDPDGQPVSVPDAGEFAVGDQVAVAGHDLAHALARAGSAGEVAEAAARVRAVDLG